MKLYRYTYGYSGVLWPDKVELVKLEYPVIRETAHCYVIKHNCKDKYVLREGKNLFAFKDENKALFNFMKRKQRQIGFLKYNLRVIKDAYNLARKELGV